MTEALLKDDNEIKQENIEHIISKDQIHLRMQMLTVENEKLKKNYLKLRKAKEDEKIESD
jgi:hypothetical protein